MHGARIAAMHQGIHEPEFQMQILVTGAAGFIGSHLAHRLLDLKHLVLGLDNLNAYYDPALKAARLTRLRAREGFSFRTLDLADRAMMAKLFSEIRPDRIIHLAAQAGVRYGLENPHAYADSNLEGFLNLLEGCVKARPAHLIYASSSSVYGANSKVPFSETDVVDHPVSLYAASKRANELMAHAYAHLHGLPMTGLRFFTVFGPWGRPDMAPMKFARAILAGERVPLFNFGRMRRDFTYIDDIVEGIVSLLDHIPQAEAQDASHDPSRSHVAPHRIFNIGSDRPIELRQFLATLEAALGRKAEIELLPAQPGEVEATWADITALNAAVGYRPHTEFEHGIQNFVTWYRNYYG